MIQDRFKFRVWLKELIKPRMTYTSGLSINKNQIDDSDNIVMQCTGLKDIKQILIYEGDICKDKFGKLFTVYFDNKYACFFLRDKNNEIMAIYPDINIPILN